MRRPALLVALLHLACAGCAPAPAPLPAAPPPPVAPPPAPAPPPPVQVAAPEPEPAPLTPVPEVDRGPVVLPTPPFRYTLVEAAPLAAPAKKLTLVRLQATGNAITDVERWFSQYRLALPTITDRLPPDVPRQVGKAVLSSAIAQPDGHMLLLYRVSGRARLVAVIDPKSRLAGLFDFAAYGAAPVTRPGDEPYVAQDISWAAVEAGVLYVSHHHNTYSKSSGGMNGYVSAVDMARGKLLWRSAPLVSNAVSFVLVGGHILTGYGFTDEPDYLHVLDQATGRVEQSLHLATAAEYLVPRDGKLYVRTYDTNYIYDMRFSDLP